MKCDVGDWIYVKDKLPENYAGRLWVACMAKDGSREDWVACGIIYGHYRGTTIRGVFRCSTMIIMRLMRGCMSGILSRQRGNAKDEM